MVSAINSASQKDQLVRVNALIEALDRFHSETNKFEFSQSKDQIARDLLEKLETDQAKLKLTGQNIQNLILEGNADSAILSSQLDPIVETFSNSVGKIYFNLANLYSRFEYWSESISAFRAADRYNPGDHLILNNLALSLTQNGDFSEAISIFEDLEDNDTTQAETLNNHGNTLRILGELEKAEEKYRLALSIDPTLSNAEKNLLNIQLNYASISSKELFKNRLKIVQRHENKNLDRGKFKHYDWNPDRKLQLGIVSSDFRNHPAGLNVLPLVSNLTRENFNLTIYSEVRRPDAITETFKEHSDKYCSTVGLSDLEVAKQIEEDKIDILLTIAGQFDENRLFVNCHRPAPIQITFHDCSSSGLAEMDYWLSDNILHPENTSESYSEIIYRLPVYYQYPAPNEYPEPTPSPCLTNGHVTFGCFNKPEKIGEQVIALWSKIMLEVPNSKLILKFKNYYGDPGLKQKFTDLFAKNNISEDRLIFISNSDSIADHLRLYDQIDIALDPFPFNGATTTFQALAMGVAVVTLLGKNFIDRVAASIVTHAGYPEFVNERTSDYISCAKKLASNPERLARLRAEMRENLSRSALCNGPVYASHVEAAFRDMWHRRCPILT